MSTDDRQEAESTKRFRSPPYPQLTLGRAIERARELHDKVHSHTANIAVAANAWGLSASSGGFWTTIAAMVQYGLVNSEGSGDKRRFQLSDAALRIIKDPDPQSEKRRSALQRSALAPMIHAELWQRFKASPSDLLLKGYLTLDRRDEGKAPYSDNAADDVIKVYRDALAFAGVEDGGTITSDDGAKEPPFSPYQAAGREPLMQDAAQTEPRPPPTPMEHKRIAREWSAEFSSGPLADGERELTSGLLSRSASFRLIVSGHVGVKELERLIRKLELDKEILAEPDDEA